jgi:antitoxin (DNA-binding transcriptional repressor) of toxin-antitoxin stability system
MQIPITEAHKRFDELAEIVEAGQVITITRYGKPMFQMRPHILAIRPSNSNADSAKDVSLNQ